MDIYVRTVEKLAIIEFVNTVVNDLSWAADKGREGDIRTPLESNRKLTDALNTWPRYPTSLNSKSLSLTL